MQDTVLTSEFYTRIWERRYSGRQDGIVRPSLLREQAVAGVVAAMDKKLQSVKQKPEFMAALRSYVMNQSPVIVPFSEMSPEASAEIERELAWYLQRHAVPYAPYFPIVQQLAIEMLAEYESQDPSHGVARASKLFELEQGVKLTLYASLANLVRSFGMWSIESFNGILQIWSNS